MTTGNVAIIALTGILAGAVIALIVTEVLQHRRGKDSARGEVSRQAIKAFTVAAFVGLLTSIGTRDLTYGLGVFVIVFLGFGGYEFLIRRRN